MLTKKLFFDTNVCEILSKPKHAVLLKALQKHFFGGFRLLIAPTTIFELLDGLARSDRKYFRDHQARFKVLALSSGLRCLPHPAAFVIKRILGRPAPRPGFEPTNFAQWIKIILAARSYEDVVQGKVKLPGVKLGYGMDFLAFSAQMDEGKSEHAKLLVSVRNGTQGRPTPEQWASSILAMNGCPVGLSDEAKRVAAALDGAYRLDSFLWEMAKNNTYDFLKHASDWLDIEHLHYLADPSIHFLTNDKSTIMSRLSGTPQANRILILAEEAKRLGLSVT
jgi:hypothetical protein